jgi:glycosyltransferase XagB
MGADGESAKQLFLPLLGGGIRERPPNKANAHLAAHALALRQPDESAIRTLTKPQAVAFILIAFCGMIWFMLAPTSFLEAAGLASFLTFVAAFVFRCCIYLSGAAAVQAVERRDTALKNDRELVWPVYTVLIALKDEAASAAQLSAAICGLDYPRDKLDVKLLIEEGDEATRLALIAQDWPQGTGLLVVPPGDPKTKPRALNYGLLSAKGEFVVVYDAEDRPDKDQLKAAVRAFRAGSRDLACVQAPLVGDGDKGWIAGQWALEYAVQFGRLLPGLAALGFPIPLGGTSNHFRRVHLEAADGWDAWNVTEDADLGLRLARRGKQVQVITPPTLEAPPERFGVWLAQRSRWLKGFLQTWLVVMRKPGKAIRDMGLLNFMALQLTLGAAILSGIAHGPWVVWLAASVIWPGAAIAPVFMGFIAVSYLAGILMALAAPGEKSARRLLLALTLPLYWPLQSLAMARAIYSLLRRPHYWAKTPHEDLGQAAASGA